MKIKEGKIVVVFFEKFIYMKENKYVIINIFEIDY